MAFQNLFVTSSVFFSWWLCFRHNAFLLFLKNSKYVISLVFFSLSLFWEHSSPSYLNSLRWTVSPSSASITPTFSVKPILTSPFKITTNFPPPNLHQLVPFFIFASTCYLLWYYIICSLLCVLFIVDIFLLDCVDLKQIDCRIFPQKRWAYSESAEDCNGGLQT